MTQQATPIPAPGLRSGFALSRGEGFRLDISLDIAPGTTAALLGPNGAGKSTTVHALAGIIPIDGGRIELDGRIVDDPAAATFVPTEDRRVGVVFQEYLLFDHLSVVDNVGFGPRAAGKTRRDARSIARHWIDVLDLADLAHRRPPELSGGQAQRVALARALAAEPSLLLFDEPLAALDVATRTELRRTLAHSLAHCPGPRLLITHDPTDAFLLADRIHILERGHITQVGTADDIRRRPATPYAAALAGLNLLTGTNRRGSITLDQHGLELVTSDTHTTGSVLITIHPNAIALHTGPPHGSPRNAWPTTVAAVEPLGEITRVTLDLPLPVGVDVTPAAVSSLDIVPGVGVWASVKATEIHVNPA